MCRRTPPPKVLLSGARWVNSEERLEENLKSLKLIRNLMGQLVILSIWLSAINVLCESTLLFRRAIAARKLAIKPRMVKVNTTCGNATKCSR